MRDRFYTLCTLTPCLVLLIGQQVLRAQNTAGSNGPDPHEIPIPRIQTPLGTLPGVDALPVRKDLPDVMVMNDGTKVTTRRQWERRREEMKRTLAYYAVGQMPPPPGNVNGQEIKSETVLDGSVKYRLVHLTFGPAEKLSLNIGIFTPVKGGPFPAIILQSATPPGATPYPVCRKARIRDAAKTSCSWSVRRRPQHRRSIVRSPQHRRYQGSWTRLRSAAHGRVHGEPARGCVPPRVRAGDLQPERLRRGHHAAQRRWQLGIPQHALLSGLSRLRLGHPRRLGVGRLPRRRLSRKGSRDRQDQAHHHRRVAQRKVLHGCGGL